jgi:hypothetical protein
VDLSQFKDRSKAGVNIEVAALIAADVSKQLVFFQKDELNI